MRLFDYDEEAFVSQKSEGNRRTLAEGYRPVMFAFGNLEETYRDIVTRCSNVLHHAAGHAHARR